MVKKIIFACLVLTLAACTRVKLYEQLPSVRRVAVIAGPQHYEAEITAQAFDRFPWTFVTRSQMNALLREQNFQLSSDVNPDTAVRVGKVAGVGAILTGGVNTREWTEWHGNRISSGTYHYCKASCWVQLIDCENGEILATTSEEGYRRRDCYETVESCADKAMGKLVNQKARRRRY